jgi:hypothetical protein
MYTDIPIGLLLCQIKALGKLVYQSYYILYFISCIVSQRDMYKSLYCKYNGFLSEYTFVGIKNTRQFEHCNTLVIHALGKAHVVA